MAETLGQLPTRIDIYAIELGVLTDDKLSESVATAARELASLLVEKMN